MRHALLEERQAGTQELTGLQIGNRLKRARVLGGLRLRDVADRAGCSESMLSKIENDRVTPSLTTLHRLCKALSVSISTLLSEDEPRIWHVLRPERRQLIGYSASRDGEGTKAEVLVPYAEGRMLEGFVVTIEPGGHSGGFLQHKGEEVGFVLEGELELTIDGVVNQLRPGDSFYFPSHLPHAYRNAGLAQMRAIWINTPPTF